MRRFRSSSALASWRRVPPAPGAAVRPTPHKHRFRRSNNMRLVSIFSLQCCNPRQIPIALQCILCYEQHLQTMPLSRCRPFWERGRSERRMTKVASSPPKRRSA